MCCRHQPDSWQGMGGSLLGPQPSARSAAAVASLLRRIALSLFMAVRLANRGHDLAILVPLRPPWLASEPWDRRSGFPPCAGALGNLPSPVCADPLVWLLMPALVERTVVFRVALPAHPLDGGKVLAGTLALRASLSLAAVW